MEESIMAYNILDGWIQGLARKEEIVRCKDCKHRDIYYIPSIEKYICDVMSYCVPDDGYCYKGERRKL